MTSNPPSSHALVVVPTYREAENIDEILGQLLRHADVQVLIVDDNSNDGTEEKVQAHSERHPGRVHILQRPGKLGLASAYVEGFSWGLERDFQRLVGMDADLSHDPAQVPVLLKHLEKSPVALGSRYVEGGGTQNWSFFRRCLSRFGSIYSRSILGLPLRDMTGGFMAWRREVLENLRLDSIRSEGYAFLIELKFRAHLAGYEFQESPILFEERRAGQSKMSWKIILEGVTRVWALALQRRQLRKELGSPGKSRITDSAPNS